MKNFVGLAVLGAAFAGNAHALTNEEFVKEVQRHESVLEKDEKAFKDAHQFCSALSAVRRDEEPRCVALQKLARGKTEFKKSPARAW